MLVTYRLPLTDRKVKEKQAMKQQKAMLIALIVICITVVMAVLVTRKDLCEVRIRTGQTEVAVFTAYESEE
ncbi:type I toxin-antitoxin system Hok family toxin [Salmonella enterica]|uniref:Type I toxin-antitoxin system Hok family toxin n=4 Tax=Salmonella enterica TaxID=28901 RepID=A0A735IT07_SALET|nr:type I toxin-antitoxin system hok family toxin [Salmonella enterica subsp. enterica]EAA2696801.1 type I toxin-antitoxin system hok family toxin [Salmonella enterica]EBG2928268.1 type I toxin-antitoxin system Hok family toxin [Salmonella enterica subsp. enterica serovar Adelaide]EBL6422618.1 type I toxin-antitoxin system Hok family toxin [Salmonella enterica subsp. enterica serovar Give]EBP3773710.1 type I toxin-antitoxin system Hok family toxin [Salmonella enterica subsp. arizonae]EBQ960170